MPTGWVRAWDEEHAQGGFESGSARSRWRRQFRTSLHESEDPSSAVLAELGWGDEVRLPAGIGGDEWTAVEADGEQGFMRRDHLVEVAWVDRTEDGGFTASLHFHDEGEVDLLWGDLVQVLHRSGDTCRVRARGLWGTMDGRRLRPTALLELYFIDVGQGDGVLLRTPSGRHMLLDGGIARSVQMTGKNAADFVDWKFHRDYGDYRVKLDALVASHCDYDHYGGLWDLIRLEPDDDDELDCAEVEVVEFFHAGLSRWKDRDGVDPPHRDGLGPNDGTWIRRLLGDRSDAEASVVHGAEEALQGYWGWFVDDVLTRHPEAGVQRLGVDADTLTAGGTFPRVWPDEPGVDIHVLAPITRMVEGAPALLDLGDRGQNTNGHSICLRVDHGAARILLTGDLNKASQDWIMDAYGDRIAAFNCDVAKACHHGSGDISIAFLERINAAATVISSGDAEGYAHPRPEVVAASAVTGFVTVDREADRLITPLVYMTEIERSVEVGEVSHITITRYPDSDGGEDDGALFALPRHEIADGALPTWHDRQRMREEPEEADRIEEEAEDREAGHLDRMDALQRAARTRAEYHYRSPHRLFSTRYGNQSVWRSRIMTRTHYGLVNVRTDGETVMCATMRESGSGWTVHTFPARFGPRS